MREARSEVEGNIKDLQRSLEQLEHKMRHCDVMHVQLGEVSEVFSPPRVTKTAESVGVSCGQTYDLTNGYDFTKAEVRKTVLEELKMARPSLIMLSPPCDQFSLLGALRGYRGSAGWIQKIYQARVLLRFAMQVAVQQIELGGLFVFEHPQGALSWNERCVEKVRKHVGVECVTVDQCMFGLKDKVSKLPHRKRTRIMSNSSCICQALQRVCDGSHVHQHLIGKVKVAGQWQSRSRLAQEYPEEFCRAVVQGFLREKRDREESTVKHCVHVTEDLADNQSESKVMRVLRRCHENLGHPSNTKLIAMLRSAKASERCIKLAKGLKCPACEVNSRVKPHPVARLEHAGKFNQLVAMDTFEIELPWRKLKLLNIVDMATRYQVCIPMWKGIDAKRTRVAFRRYWKRWAGSPVKVWSDGGPEFSEAFSNGLEADGVWHEVSAAHSPWQNGVVERQGGAWKDAYNKAVLGVNLESKMEAEELFDQLTLAHNTMTRRDGYSPCQHVLGAEPRIPGLLANGEDNEIVASGLRVGETAYERRHAIRQAARAAFIEADHEVKLRKAAAHRTRTRGGELQMGDLVYIWRKGLGETRPHWHGPGHVLGKQGSRIWVAQGAKVYRCSPEQVKRLSAEQESLLKLLPDDLKVCRRSLHERGAGNVVALDGGAVPPAEEQEANEEERDQEVVPRPGEHERVLGVPMEVDSATSGAVEAETAVEGDVGVDAEGSTDAVGTDAVGQADETMDHAEEDVEMPLEESGNAPRQLSVEEPEPHGEPESASSDSVPSAMTPSASGGLSYGPVRNVPALSRAMRRDPELLDRGRPARSKTESERNKTEHEILEVEHVLEFGILDEEVLTAELKKKRKAEVPLKQLSELEKTRLPEFKSVEWSKMLSTQSVKVHSGPKAAELVARCGVERVLKSRFVLTRPDDTEKQRQGVVKARWCVRGYLDPDVLELDTAAPTLSVEGLAIALQLIACKRWTLGIGDVEAAFLRGDNIQRSKGKILVQAPEDGIPGVPPGSVIELLKPVYGLVDAPRAWNESFSRSLRELGCRQSALDPCLFYSYGKNDAWSEVQGVIALHVDDLLFGGTSMFEREIMGSLRERYPFKHFKKQAGEFLGRHVRQTEDFAIHVEQKDYAEQVECLSLSKERRRHRESEVTEDERRQMRAALGELNWLVSCSRPDLAACCSLLQQKVARACVKDLVEVNKVIAMARDYAAVEIVIRPLELQDVEFCVWSDASWANATEKMSQGGYLVMATTPELRRNNWAKVSPLRWRSYKQDRQVASTLGAELLALSRSLAEAKWIRSMWQEATQKGYSMEKDKSWSNQVPITVCVDNKPVFDHLNGQVLTIKDKRLAIEMLLVKKDVAQDNVIVRWLPTYQMLADCLTKAGAQATLLRRTLREGKMILIEDEKIKGWTQKRNQE